jgi:1-pyrroline-5-carboxylate dehydrogenase
MAKGFFTLPEAKNEAVKVYRPQSPERIELQSMLHELRSAEIEIPMVIGGKKVFTADRVRMFPPHEIKHTLGHYSQGDSTHLAMAIDAAQAARPRWSQLPWQHRASIFLKAAELISALFVRKSMQPPCLPVEKCLSV